MEALGGAGLQSGFVLAVILAAVLFAERAGGSGALAQRAFQVALGIALLFLVASATTAFVRPPDLGDEFAFDQALFDEGITDGADEEAGLSFLSEIAQNGSEVGTIHAGVGLLFVVGGLLALQRLSVLPLGVVLGGVLLLISGGGQGAGPSSDSSSIFGVFDLFYGALGAAAGTGVVHDTIRFCVLLVGTVALAGVGFVRWEGKTAQPAPA